MSRITIIHKTYYQKSMLFLYPLLGIRRHCGVSPETSYLRWQGKFGSEDRRLIVKYAIREDITFKLFETEKLLNNPLFSEMMLLEDNFVAYVFDFNKNDMADAYDAVISGKYSKLPENHKRRLLDFYNNDKNKSHVTYIDSFVYPQKYFGTYADLLTVPNSHGGSKRAEILQTLTRNGELCSPPNVDKETLRTEPVDLEIQRKPLPLPHKFKNQH